MKHSEFVNRMYDSGDAYINYISPISKKLKYHIGTTDFSEKTSPYVANKWKAYQNKQEVNNTTVVVFCWDLDEFKYINLSQVTFVIPLNQIIKQP